MSCEPTEQKVISEREAVLREREAWTRARVGATLHNYHPRIAGATVGCAECEHARQRARELYPLPKVTRPRVVTDSDCYQWRAVGGSLQWRKRDSAVWSAEDVTVVRPSQVALLAELLANPNETVDAD